MTDWLIFFGLSFFSDKIAKEARVRGVSNCVLGFFLCLVFIFCGVLAANTVPFSVHYKNASEFRSVVYSTVDAASVGVDGDRAVAERVIDTIREPDGADFPLYGYNVVVDTRPTTVLDDFEAYCVKKSDKSEIGYEEYLLLADEQKGDYDFAVRYTPNELVLTDALTQEHENYLRDHSESVNNELQAIAAEKSGDEYRSAVYALYVKTYYPDMTKFERVGEVPLLRSYYYRNYLNTNDITKSLFVFSDMFVGYFDTDDGLAVAFYGPYTKAANGAVTRDNADAFVKSVFDGSTSISANMYLMNTCKYIPIIALIPVVLALVAKLVLARCKNEKFKKYTVCLKIEFSYFAVAALLTFIILFVCGFFVSSNTLNILPLILFGVIMAARTAVYLIREVLAYKKTVREEQESGEEAASEEAVEN